MAKSRKKYVQLANGVRVFVRPGETADDVMQHLDRWRREQAFHIARVPELAAKARKLGILDAEVTPPPKPKTN